MTIIIEQNRPICKKCNESPCAKHGISKHGFQKYRTLCVSCHKLTKPKFLYKNYRKDNCEHCGFVPKHPCQLDVDHIDGNHNNDNPSNLQTLCANCHRLKTYTNNEHLNEKWRDYSLQCFLL